MADVLGASVRTLPDLHFPLDDVHVFISVGGRHDLDRPGHDDRLVTRPAPAEQAHVSAPSVEPSARPHA